MKRLSEIINIELVHDKAQQLIPPQLVETDWKSKFNKIKNNKNQNSLLSNFNESFIYLLIIEFNFSSADINLTAIATSIIIIAVIPAMYFKIDTKQAAKVKSIYSLTIYKAVSLKT